MGLIYHIATTADWDRACRDGEYTTSTRGRTLAEEGFIHASTASQVALVANAFYQGEPDLLLLVIDTALVGPEIRYEPVPGQASPYPHIYGPLNASAVVEARPFGPGPDGQFSFGPGLDGQFSFGPGPDGQFSFDEK
jgi:glutathione S-transferase